MNTRLSQHSLAIAQSSYLESAEREPPNSAWQYLRQEDVAGIIVISRSKRVSQRALKGPRSARPKETASRA
jgi:hypothetical protein